MFYFAVSLSAINPHCCALEASALACFPQVGIQLGAGAISFSATVCPPQSFVKNAGAVPVEKTVDSWEIYIQKKEEKGGRETEENSKAMSTKTGKKNLLNCCQRRYKLGLWWVTILSKICIGDKGFVSFLCLFNELHLSTPYPQLFN